MAMRFMERPAGIRFVSLLLAIVPGFLGLSCSIAPLASRPVTVPGHPPVRSESISQEVSSPEKAKTQPTPRPIQEKEIPEIPAVQEKLEKTSPQRVASMGLVEQGKRALLQGRLDAALQLFEEAVKVDGYNGIAFYGLAQVWITKGYPGRSLEFARKASLLLQNDPQRLEKVYLLMARIYERLNDPEKSRSYREKAMRLHVLGP